MTTSRHDRAVAVAMEAVQRVNDALNEIIAIMGEDVRKIEFKTGSSWGLSCFVIGRITPVTVPDEWVNSWAIVYDNNKEYVISQVREACRWVEDDRERAKTEKGLRRFLGGWVSRSWKRDMAGRPAAAGSLRGYEKKHGGA